MAAGDAPGFSSRQAVRLLTPHSCSHTYVSQMQAVGVDLDMTRHYHHVQEPVRQATAERFSEIFGAESD